MPAAALGQRFNRKLGEFDPSGNDRLTLPDTEVKTPDGEGVGSGRNREINVGPAQAVAFASRSSLAALPAVYEGARVGLALPEDIYNLFLPLAASMFRVGGPMVQIVGVLFLTKLYGVVLNPWQLTTITVMAVATSLTIPGVPAGGVIVMAPVLTSVNLPAAGIGILLAVDTIPDMFRAPANVTGWLCVCSILSRGAAPTPKVGIAQSAVG